MLTAGIAVYRLWLEKGGAPPALVAGHSLGEYSALVAAGVLQLKDAVPLVELRAKAMQAAVPAGEGAMAAVMGLDAAGVMAACAEGGAGPGGAGGEFQRAEADRDRRPQGGGRACGGSWSRPKAPSAR
jgi:[acyl-carrier-protein] S-malonyltransferase